MISTLEKVYLVYKPVFPLYNKWKVLNQCSSIDILFIKMNERGQILCSCDYILIFLGMQTYFQLRGEQ